MAPCQLHVLRTGCTGTLPVKPGADSGCTGKLPVQTAEPSEPESEEGPEPTKHEHSEHHPEHHPDHPEHNPEHNPEHHHDYKHMKDKFLNEITHLPSRSTLRCCHGVGLHKMHS